MKGGEKMEQELIEVLKELVNRIEVLTDEITGAIENQNEYLYNIERRLDGIERNL